MTRRASRGSAPADTAGTTRFVPPYPPSWVDRLADWVDGLPGWAWVYYAASVLVLAALSGLAQWLAHPDTFDPRALAFALYPAYMVGLTHYLDRQATLALEAFRPALKIGEADYARLRYELTTVPASGAWIASALGIPATYLFVVAPQAADFPLRAMPEQVLAVLMTLFTAATFLVLILHTIRQLRKVSELHAAAAHLNLLQPRPTYAFSRLTSRSAIGVLAFLYFDFLINPPAPGTALPYLVLLVAALTVEAGAFVLPLLGMHQRLAREKARLESEVNEAIEIAYRELREQVHAKTLSHVDELDKALSGLFRMREAAAKLSTWPWQPETLRGMLAAVGLPIVIWLIQFGLQRILG
jgi:hypothetical protein